MAGLDLGRIIAQAEGIKNLRREGETSQLRQRYMQTQMAGAEQQQQYAQEDRVAEVDARTAKKHYIEADYVERAQDPIAAAHEFVPEMVQAFEAKNGQGSFQQLQPDQVRQMVGQAKAKAASIAGIAPATPEAFTLKPGEARFVGGQQVASVDPKPETITPYQQQQLSLDRERLGIARSEAQRRGEDASGKIRKDVQQLRKEFRGLPSVKEYETVLPLISSAEKAPDTPQGDLQLIYTVGKILDPGSVVREGELELTANAAPFLQKAIGRARKEAGKGRLTPATRADMLNMLNQRVQGYKDSYERDRQQYSQYASEAQLDPSQVVGQPHETARSGSVKRVKVDANGDVIQ